MRMQFVYNNEHDYNVCEYCGCHDEGNLVVIPTTETGNHLVCEHCAQKHFVRSYDCDWHDIDHINKNVLPTAFKISTDFYNGPNRLYRLGQFISPQAFGDYGMRFCDCCNTVVNKFDRQTVWVDGDDLRYCDDCVSEYIEDDPDYHRCCDCGEWVEEDNMYWADCHDDWLCESCYDSGDYVRCYHCDSVYQSDDCHNDEYGDWYCDRCYENGHGDFPARDDDDGEDYEPSREEGEHMHDYGYDPDKFVFYKTADEVAWSRIQRERGQAVRFLYLGFELESSHLDYDDRDEHSEIIHDCLNPNGEETWFYQKHDSSLNKGIEMVSHPMTLNYLQEVVRPVIEDNLPDTTKYIGGGESDGFHIHLSRGGMNLGHRIRFGAFFELCKYQLEICARRSGNSYAQFMSGWDMNRVAKPKDLIEILKDKAWERRRCVNWLNSKTVEVRMFRSTSDPSDLYAAFELVHAIYQFTKHVSWRKMFYAGRCGVLWDWFLDFAAQDSRYLDLFDQLDRLDSNHNLGSVKDDSGDDLDYYFMPRDHDMYEIPCSIIINRVSNEIMGR